MSEPYTSRIGVVDFFSVLVPGFYIVLSVTLFVTWLVGVQSLTETRSWLKELTGPETWFLSALVLLGSYVVGTVVRAISVTRIERICIWWKRPRPSTFRIQADFPYWTDLLENLKRIRNHRSLLKGKPEEATSCPTVFFDYMKMVLCTCCPEAFAYTQSLEARVRFAAGILLGSFLSTFLMIVPFSLMVLAIRRGLPWPREWFIAVVVLLVLSVVLWIILAGLFRRIRFEEANQVFLAYLAHRWKEEPQAATGEVGSSTGA